MINYTLTHFWYFRENEHFVNQSTINQNRSKEERKNDNTRGEEQVEKKRVVQLCSGLERL